jgi:hypothetical protein
MTEIEREALYKIVTKHVDHLSEHFDSVQIHCSKLDDGGDQTLTFNSGSGNFHSRRDMAREWVAYTDEINLCKARKDAEAT